MRWKKAENEFDRCPIIILNSKTRNIEEQISVNGARDNVIISWSHLLFKKKNTVTYRPTFPLDEITFVDSVSALQPHPTGTK